MTPQDDSTPPHMTNRERQVLEHLSRGCSSKETALLIGAAPRTVEAHIASLRIKLRARNASHLVWLAYRCGALGLRPH